MIGVLIFCSRDAAAYERACALASAVGARFVDRLSSDMRELALVVKFRVVEAACVIFVRGGQVIARIPRLPSEEELRADLGRLGSGIPAELLDGPVGAR